MKTAFKAKIILETDQFFDEVTRGDYPNPTTARFTWVSIMKAINDGKFEMEIVHDMYTNDFEPVIIIRDKKEQELKEKHFNCPNCKRELDVIL